MKESIDVIMLPTEDSTAVIVRHKGINQGIPHFREYYGAAMLDMGDKYQHLYVTISQDVEAIKVGDWCLAGIDQIIKYNNDCSLKTLRKIIATTDESLNISNRPNSDHPYNLNLPQLQKSFIQAYCANHDGEWVVEYELKPIPSRVPVEYGKLIDADNPLNHRLKLHKDNTINITLVEERMYSREEVMELLAQYTRDTNTFHAEKFDDWVNDNI